MRIPNPVIAVVADELYQHHTHAELNQLFMASGALGEAPVGNKLDKCTRWMQQVNGSKSPDPLSVLGSLLENYMEVEIAPHAFNAESWQAGRERVTRALAQAGLAYHQGGKIILAGASIPTRSLNAILQQRDIPAVMEELERIVDSTESKPKDAVTGACAMIESLCKVYIEDEDLEMPAEQTIKPLWKLVSKHLGFDPAAIEDDDLKKVLSGLTSIVDGLGGFRTHAGSAHGHGHKTYKPKPRHARLVASAASCLAAFIIETWNERKPS
jgi:hypothetical protein